MRWKRFLEGRIYFDLSVKRCCTYLREALFDVRCFLEEIKYTDISEKYLLINLEEELHGKVFSYSKGVIVTKVEEYFKSNRE